MCCCGRAGGGGPCWLEVDCDLECDGWGGIKWSFPTCKKEKACQHGRGRNPRCRRTVAALRFGGRLLCLDPFGVALGQVPIALAVAVSLPIAFARLAIAVPVAPFAAGGAWVRRLVSERRLLLLLLLGSRRERWHWAASLL